MRQGFAELGAGMSHITTLLERLGQRDFMLDSSSLCAAPGR
jgi:hypothetical protein